MRGIFKFLLLFSMVSSATWASEVSFSAFSEKIQRSDFCSIDLNLPVLVASNHASPPVQAFVEKNNQLWRERAENLKKEWLTDITSNKGMCSDLPNSNEISYSFEIQTPLDANRVSILFTNYSFTGGAHGIALLEAETFDTADGHKYESLSDFFDDNRLPAIKAAILEKLKQDPDFDPEFGFNSWSKETESLSKISNFYFTKDGMAVFFQQYEVGPYAAGHITAYFDWAELQALGIKLSANH